MAGRTASGWGRVVRRGLALAGWTVPLAYIGASLVVADDPLGALIRGTGAPEDAVLALALPVFFVALVARLLLAARDDSERAKALVALAVGITAWAIGAGSVTTAGGASVSYPAPGELWMLSGYLGIAAYFYLRAGRGGWRRSGPALESVITFGGALCVSGILLALLAAAGFGRQGMPLLVALISPTLDLALLLVIAGQVLAGSRSLTWGTARVFGGLMSIGAGDTAMTFFMAQGNYSQGLLVNMSFSLGFWLIVSGAVAERPPREQPARRVGSSFVTLVAAAAAVVVLALRPGGNVGAVLLALSVVTLFAAGGRLMLALHELTGAAEAYRLSLTDDLTGLPNRRALLKELTDRLAVGAPTSLVLLDLDGFKEINDTLGHAAGDAVLGIVATRLARSPSGARLAARLGGDEFALVFDETEPEAVVRTSHAIRALVRKAADVDGMELSVESSLGVAVSGPAAPVPDHRELLRRADVAMYQAKAAGEGVEIYDPTRDEFSRHRLQLTQELARGIEDGQLRLWYQPQIDARTGDVVSVEALVRWQHPSRGLVPPGEFFPAARRGGLMTVLTQEIIRMALDEAVGWYRSGLDIGLAVNVAPTELLSPTVMSGLVGHLHAVGLPPDHLVVEVTEDSFLAQPDRALEVILGLREAGVQVSIDDYGTGFSSLAYLKSLPVQEIKIDQSFVRDVLVDPRARVIVMSTIELARGLDLRLVAEGVEDPETAGALADLGVDLLQGFHFARPMPGDRVPGWVAEHTAVARAPGTR